MQGKLNDLARAFAVAGLMLAACSREAPPPAEPETVVEHRDDEDANLDVWLEQMEVGSRELYSARMAVVDAVGLEEGAVVADIGAGTGLYSLLFAEAVGPDGRVFAEDIEPMFLDLINQRAEDAGLSNITAVFGRENDVSLPDASVDVVFIADTYHYFEDRESVMKTVYRALKPGGSLIIIDYDLKADAPRPADMAHVRFGKAGVVSEIEYIGFALADDVSVPGLSENYFLRFEKRENGAADPAPPSGQ